MRRRLHGRLWFVIVQCLAAAAWLSPALPLRAAETEAQRRERLESMSAEEKQELVKKQELFEQQPPEEQKRMRELHRDLQQGEDGERLREVLDRYYAWLRTLPSNERAKLLELPADERLRQIRDKMRKQEEERFTNLVARKLQREDFRAIQQWLKTFMEAHEEEILAALPENRRPQEIDDGNRGFLSMVMMGAWSQNDSSMPRPTKEEVEQLKASLSPTAQQALASAPGGVVDVETQLREWLRAAAMSRARPTASPEELRKFYLELSAEDRERLDNLSGDELQSALQRLHNEHRMRRYWGGPFRGPRGRGDGGDRREENEDGGRHQDDGPRGRDDDDHSRDEESNRNDRRGDRRHGGRSGERDDRPSPDRSQPSE